MMAKKYLKKPTIKGKKTKFKTIIILLIKNNKINSGNNNNFF